MESYDILVRNEHTGEHHLVSIRSVSATDAQIDALVQLFRERGWRKAVALQARSAEVPSPTPAG